MAHGSSSNPSNQTKENEALRIKVLKSKFHMEPPTDIVESTKLASDRGSSREAGHGVLLNSLQASLNVQNIKLNMIWAYLGNLLEHV